MNLHPDNLEVFFRGYVGYNSTIQMNQAQNVASRFIPAPYAKHQGVRKQIDTAFF